MKTRKAHVELTWNGAAVSRKMLGSHSEVTYKDPDSGEADCLDISMQDRDRQWTTAWLPAKGDTMTASIKVTDWDKEGDNRVLPCGFFILDDFEFSGWPVTGNISGVSVPADSAFRETERSKTWQKVTIQEIGKEIAKRAGISLVWDVQGEPFTIKSIEQSNQTDCAFFSALCQTYGYAMKVYAQKIVVFDREQYKKKAPVAKIKESDIASFHWKETLAGTYTGGEYTYTDPSTEKEIKATVGTGNRILKLSDKADNKADAERKLEAAINNANHKATTLEIAVKGNAQWVASQCVTVVGVGRLSGKYYIDSVTHHIGNGYTMELELSLVANMTLEVIQDAIERLTVVGVINSPAYWVSHYKDVNYLDSLLLNLGTRIKTNLGGTSVTTVAQALTVLTDCGIINSPDYWAGKYLALAWLDRLIINAANALTPKK